MREKILQFKVLICCVLISSVSWAADSYDLERRAKAFQANYNVKIYYDSDDSQIFTKKYLRAPYYGTCGQIKKIEAAIAFVAIDSFLKTYPKHLIRKNLKKIVLCRELEFHNLRNFYTGAVLVHKKMIFVEYYPALDELRDILHHEFSSILLKEYGHLFPRLKWHQNSAKYSNKPYEAWPRGTSVHRGTVGLHRKGFLSCPSADNFEDDFNIFAAAYFVKRKYLQKKIKNYPRLQKKYKIIESFYKKIFTVEG